VFSVSLLKGIISYLRSGFEIYLAAGFQCMKAGKKVISQGKAINKRMHRI